MGNIFDEVANQGPSGQSSGGGLPGDQWFGWAKDAAKKLWQTGDLGPIQFGTGFRQIANIPEDIKGGKYANAASDLIEGGGRVLAPIGIAGAVASGVGIPALALGAGAGIGLGAAGAAAGESAAKLAGAGPDVQRLSGNVGGLLGGEAGGRYGPRAVGGLLTDLAAARAKAAAKSPFSQTQPSLLNPVEQEAMVEAARDPELSQSLDMAIASGNPSLRTTRDILPKIPGSGAGGKMRNQLAIVSDKLAGTGLDVAPSGAADRTSASQIATKAINDKIADYGSQARGHYDDLRALAKQNPQSVPMGRDSFGNPVYEDVEGPVSYDALQKIAGPLREGLTQGMTGGGQSPPMGTSKTLDLLNRIMSRRPFEPVDNALFDDNALANLTKSENDAGLKTYAAAVAAKLRPALNSAISDTAFDMGPDAQRALALGRDANGLKYELARDVGSVRKAVDPNALANQVLLGKDAGIKSLLAIQKHTPGVLPDLARALTEDIMGDVTRGGDVQRVQSAINRWENLGDRTRAILFTPEQQATIRNRLQYALKVRSTTNPSGSGPAMTLWDVVKGATNPVTTAAKMLGARITANKMFDAGRARDMVLGVPPPPPRTYKIPGLLYGAGAGLGAATAPYVDRDVIDERPDARSLLFQ